MSYGIENKDTTTTRTTADHERDTTRDAEQGDDFSRYLTATKAATASGETFKPLDPETAAHVQRLADALGDTTDAPGSRHRPEDRASAAAEDIDQRETL